MGIALSEHEAWERLASAHTGIFTTVRADGRPVPLPVWFAVLDRAVYLRTPAKSAKVKRIRNDPRAAFLVEAGTSWVELTAVLVQGEAHLVEDAQERARANVALGEKYAAYGIPLDTAPQASLKHYGAGMAVVRFDPGGAPVTWDNSRLRMQRRDARADPEASLPKAAE